MTDAHVRMSLELQAAFGLRREEAIKFTPAYTDRGDRVRLSASWTKGGRAREIPIWNESQRAVLDAARRLVGVRALILGGRNYTAHRPAQGLREANRRGGVYTPRVRNYSLLITTSCRLVQYGVWGIHGERARLRLFEAIGDGPCG